MAFSLAESLQRIGVAQATALELSRQITTQTGSVNKLLAVGIPVGQAKYIADSVSTGDVSAPKLVAHGMPGEVAKVVADAIATAPVVTSNPSIEGDAIVSETLETDGGTASGPGTITTSLQWYRDGSAISGATSDTYTIEAEDEGSMISVGATFCNANGCAAEVFSNEVGPVAGA